MKCVLKYAGGKAEQIIKALEGSEYEIVACTNKWPETIQSEKDAWLIYKVAAKYAAKEIDKVLISADVNMTTTEVMVKEMLTLKIDVNDILIIKPEFFEHFDVEQICTYADFRRLHYLEFHIADHCNLKCKGCDHFSSLVQGEVFADYNEVKRDLFRLKEIVQYIDNIHILGGEPFLNKDINQYIELVKEVYPYAKLAVVTNGLLLRTLPDAVFECILRNNVEVQVSVYPPMYGKIDETVAYCQEKGIKIRCLSTVAQFAYTFDSKSGHAEMAKQVTCPCTNLYKGHITPCPQIAYLDYFNQAMGENMDVEDGRIDLYDNNLDYAGLKRELHKVRNACDRCFRVSREQMVFKEWGQTEKPFVGDYVKLD